MYTGAPLVLLVHAIEPDEVLLSMTGYLHAIKERLASGTLIRLRTKRQESGMLATTMSGCPLA